MRRIALLVLAMVFCLSQSAGALAPAPELSCIAYLVYDGDYNYPILSKNADQPRSIASITKVMTLLYAIELVEKEKIALDAVVSASARAASREGTQIKLKAGDTFTVEELLYATALVSANDAAVALAEYIAGSEGAFVSLMNQKAQELGLENTRYVDCTGLLSIFHNNYSTAAEQVELFQEALKHELFRKIMATPKYRLASQNREIENTNPLLEMEGVEGGKTGATTPAGHTLIVSRKFQGRRLIVVVLGARSRDVRNDEVKQLLEWACGNLQVLIPSDQVLTPVVVPDGVEYQVNGVLKQDFSIFAREDEDLDFATKIQLLPGLRAPVKQGQKVGELVVSQGEQEFVRLDIVAQQGTGLASWLRRIINRFLHFLKNIW